MKTKPLVLSGCIALLSSAFFGTASEADTQIEQAVRDLDGQLSTAAAAKDLEKTVSYYSDDAIVMPPNTSAARTKEAIGNVLKDFLASPGSTVSWKATKVKVAKSGDLACVSGIYEEMTIDAGGKPVRERGKYIKVWQKQADGNWKCSADIWNSDLPVPVPSGKK